LGGRRQHGDPFVIEKFQHGDPFVMDAFDVALEWKNRKYIHSVKENVTTPQEKPTA
jgi:hypothetical protein